MLRDENRMPFHGGLSAVIAYVSRSNAFCDKVFGMPANRLQPFLANIVFVFCLKAEAAAKFGTRQPF